MIDPVANTVFIEAEHGFLPLIQLAWRVWRPYDDTFDHRSGRW
jgi:hypothetical protein